MCKNALMDGEAPVSGIQVGVALNERPPLQALEPNEFLFQWETSHYLTK